MRLYHCLLALLASSLFGSLAAQPATPLNTANTGSITPLQQEFKTGI